MGQVLHGCARTTEAVRRAIQDSQESVRALAKRYSVSTSTVQKWKKRRSAADMPMGPKTPASTVLSSDEEAVVVAFRKHTLLPLDDCLYALQSTIPHLTRSSLHPRLQPHRGEGRARHAGSSGRWPCRPGHRCLQRHGISRLPDMDGDKPAKKRFKAYPIGYFHIDLAEVRTEEGKLHLFVAIDRTSRFAFARLEKKANRVTATAFLEALIDLVPYKIHTVLTDNPACSRIAAKVGLVMPDLRRFAPADRDNGVQFCYLSSKRNGPTARYFRHMFDMRCQENGIEHRLNKPNDPWTNGQVERMNRTLKDATVKRYHYETHDQLKAHLQLFLDAYNHTKRLKTLKGLTPYEFICKTWTDEPERFISDPTNYTLGLNT